MEITCSVPEKNNYTIKNVRLETAFIWDGDGAATTKTDLFCVMINHGKIAEVSSNDGQAADAIDAKGLLMLPAFSDMHVHLDKTLYGLPWQAVSSTLKTVQDMIAYEQEIIPELLKTSTHRAELLMNLLQRYGTTFARTHFNVDSTSGLRSLANLKKALDNKSEILGRN